MTGLRTVCGSLGVAVPLLLAVMGLVTDPLPTAAQSDGLVRVESLMDSGRFASARAELQAWLAANEAATDASDRQRSLWLRALLTVDPGMAERDYRRLVVEYPGGQHSDEALLRLARIARARADQTVARGYLEALLRDYPRSPHRIEARTMLEEIEASPSAGVFPSDPAEAAMADSVQAEPESVASRAPDADTAPDGDTADTADTADTVDAPEPPAAAPTDAPVPDPASLAGADTAVVEEEAAEPEPAAQVPSADEPAAAPADLAETPAPPDPVADRPPTGPTGADDMAPEPAAAPFTVQLGAFSLAAGAATIAERARAAGFDVRLALVEGSDLIRVRSGAFDDRDGAGSRALELREAGLEAVVVSDRSDESPYPADAAR